MAKKILTLEEIKKLSELLRGAFADLKALKQREPLAESIKNLSIPEDLSVSLAIRLIERSIIISELDGFAFERNVKFRDVAATLRNRVRIVEVKGTGSSGFQRLGENDVTADYLVWIHFDTYFEGTDNIPIQIYVLPSPGKYQIKGRIHLTKFIEKSGSRLHHETVRLGSLH